MQIYIKGNARTCYLICTKTARPQNVWFTVPQRIQAVRQLDGVMYTAAYNDPVVRCVEVRT